MLMPIVSMNKMAMNESVAATCCYKEQVSATNVYWEILHGGWVGSGYVATEKWQKYGEQWASLFPNYDVKGPTDADYPIITKNWAADGSLIDYEIAFTGFSFAGNYKDVAGFLYDSSSDNPFSKGKDCTHTDGNCTYLTVASEWSKNQHFESTSKHTTGGSGWADPHDAKQWTS